MRETVWRLHRWSQQDIAELAACALRVHGT
jgi:hypothetical protein